MIKLENGLTQPTADLRYLKLDQSVPQTIDTGNATMQISEIDLNIFGYLAMISGMGSGGLPAWATKNYLAIVGVDTNPTLAFVNPVSLSVHSIIYDFAADDRWEIDGNLYLDGSLTATSSGNFIGVSNGGFQRSKAVVKVSDYVIDSSDTDEIVICNKATPISITLPVSLGATTTRRKITVKSVGVGAVTIIPNGSDTIDGETTQTINQYDSIQLLDYSTGAWAII